MLLKHSTLDGDLLPVATASSATTSAPTSFMFNPELFVASNSQSERILRAGVEELLRLVHGGASAQTDAIEAGSDFPRGAGSRASASASESPPDSQPEIEGGHNADDGDDSEAQADVLNDFVKAIVVPSASETDEIMSDESHSGVQVYSDVLDAFGRSPVFVAPLARTSGRSDAGAKSATRLFQEEVAMRLDASSPQSVLFSHSVVGGPFELLSEGGRIHDLPGWGRGESGRVRPNASIVASASVVVVLIKNQVVRPELDISLQLSNTVLFTVCVMQLIVGLVMHVF